MFPEIVGVTPMSDAYAACVLSLSEPHVLIPWIEKLHGPSSTFTLDGDIIELSASMMWMISGSSSSGGGNPTSTR